MNNGSQPLGTAAPTAGQLLEVAGTFTITTNAPLVAGDFINYIILP
ncbi:MAG: hypothetical protein K1X90_13640 [Candidatus Kapabacteria bacterium]|nr:hypothetical protein [Candidatus Kapabacteria bacterium]